ncbi:MAG: type I glutamate--ammonia ligase [Candidatus Gracilibacteria bacterium]|jgi:glutamine synthetase|nr:type I glutamate--ammonia ligase [Candidatus Gracilibacteria bacterium]
MKKSEVFAICKEKNVRFVHFQFCDLFGFVKSITMPITKLEGAIDNNVWFDGSSIEGFTRIYESDMYLKPDLKTFAIVPWEGSEQEGKVARIICDVYLPDGKPFEGDPRYILKKQLERAKKMGFSDYFVGPELEFFLLEKDEDGEAILKPHDKAGYFEYAMDKAGPIRIAMSEVVSQMGIDVEAIHHEVAEGQHEIDFKYSDALTQADSVLTVKMALKAVANQFGLHATFMPKPISGINGSGMHVHQSLAKNGENIFFDDKNKYNLSETAMQFIAGQLKSIKEIVAITNPLVNSYKRLVAGYEAPVYVAWGQTNRSALIRIPKSSHQKAAARCELRCPDSSANPYLAFALMLAAGLDGVEKKMKAPDPVEENIFEFTDKKAKRMRISTLPASLIEAVSKFEKSDLVKSVLGKHTFEKYLEAKQKEVDSFRIHVSDWEIESYLDIY